MGVVATLPELSEWTLTLVRPGGGGGGGRGSEARMTKLTADNHKPLIL